MHPPIVKLALRDASRKSSSYKLQEESRDGREVVRERSGWGKVCFNCWSDWEHTDDPASRTDRLGTPSSECIIDCILVINKKHKFRIKTWGRILAVINPIQFLLRGNISVQVNGFTTDPQQAYEQTKEIFGSISTIYRPNWLILIFLLYSRSEHMQLMHKFYIHITNTLNWIS